MRSLKTQLYLALACARCNHGKGIRHDAKRKLDEAALRTIAVLQAERERRWREPPNDL